MMRTWIIKYDWYVVYSLPTYDTQTCGGVRLIRVETRKDCQMSAQESTSARLNTRLYMHITIITKNPHQTSYRYLDYFDKLGSIHKSCHALGVWMGYLEEHISCMTETFQMGRGGVLKIGQVSVT